MPGSRSTGPKPIALLPPTLYKVVPPAGLDREVDAWCEEIKALGPYSLRFLKHAFNADTDPIAGFETNSMAAARLYWGSDEARQYKKQFIEGNKARKSV